MPTRPYQIIGDGHLGGCVRADEEYPNGDPNTFLPSLWDWFIEQFGIRTVLDVGSGEGHAVAYFLKQGAKAIGIEGSHKVIDGAGRAKPYLFCHDYTRGPVVDIFSQGRDWRTADLVWSCEFVEHVEAQYVGNFLDTFLRARKILAITHALPGQHGYHHVNCRPREYWIEQIELYGTHRYDPDLTTVSREGLRRAGYWARSGLLFVNKEWQKERGSTGP
jgi:SAM-dependent methyltransferase